MIQLPEKIKQNGQVGVLHTNPQASLHVSKSSTAGTYDNGLPAIVVSNTNTSGSSFAAFKMEADNGAVVGEFFADGNNSFGVGSDVIYFRSFTNHPLAFGTNSVVRMLISNTGQVGIGQTAPVASAKLEIVSTTQGFLPPRMTATQGSAIASPAEGLMIYVTDTNGTFTTKGWWGYNGAAWQQL